MKRKLYRCSFCSGNYSTKNNLRVHIEQIHYKIRCYQCSVCKKNFTGLGNLKFHEAIHLGMQKYRCNRCDRKFTHPSNLRHHRLLCEGIAKFVCSTCGRRFYQQTNKDRHEKTHSRLPSDLFNCTFCCKTFRTSQGRKYHIGLEHSRVVDAKSTPPLIQCECCGSRFRFHSGLSRHRKNGCRERSSAKTVAIKRNKNGQPRKRAKGSIIMSPNVLCTK
mmetsp:Transcript_13381/g.21876  ORF Transcript_13381/g.21876 Transcript_13381/m.21876 type:complete len:218 (-) Transcript_13381:64-717(-)